MITTATLLSNVEHGVPSGRYDGSSLDWYSDVVQAANYYRGRGGLQTLTFRVNDFVGRIYVEAALDTVSETAHWFRVYEYGDVVTPLTDTHPETIQGNFVWIRLHIVGFDSGTIESVTISY
jgi:hypothetical protein